MTDESKVTPFYYSPSGNTEEDKKLLEPFEYISECIKKHPTLKFTSALNHWFKISPDRLRQIEEIISITFYVCLLFDDLQDHAILREGFPATHSICGFCKTINAANYAQCIAFEKVANLHPAAINILTEQLLEFYRGQGMDAYWKENFICPTEEAYKIIGMRKTTWMVKLAMKLMKLFSTYQGDVSSLLNVISLQYQIYNDYNNLCPKNVNDKSYCDDLTEGKFSFPIIHALTSNPGDSRIMNILKRRPTNIQMKRYCVDLLDKVGSLKYTRDVLQELDKKVKIEIERLGGNPLLEKVVDEIKMQNLYDVGR